MKPDSVKVRIFAVVVFVALLSATAWVTAGIAFHNKQELLTAAGIAYALGLRHGLDADHISAIDNVTRKLIGAGQISTCVGLYFSLGHSSLIFVGCLILYFTAKKWEESNPASLRILNFVSSAVASVFLIAIGVANAVQLYRTKKELSRVKKAVEDHRAKILKDQDKCMTTQCTTPEFAESVQPLASSERPTDNVLEDPFVVSPGFSGSKGCISWCAGGLFEMVTSSWMMFGVGIIFGLGFDTTASVTAIMATAAAKASGTIEGSDEAFRAITILEALILPLMFTAGMVLMDSADSIMMLGSYRWSDRKLIRKLFFNYVILLISVTAALSIGLIIFFRLIVDIAECEGENGFCDLIGFLDGQFQYIGIAITCIFVFIWVGGYFYYTHSHWSALEDEITEIFAQRELAEAQALEQAQLEDGQFEITVEADVHGLYPATKTEAPLTLPGPAAGYNKMSEASANTLMDISTPTANLRQLQQPLTQS